MRQSNWTILLNSVIIMLITSVAALSAVPPYMNYQGRLTDDVGNPIDTTAAMTFTLYTDDGTNTVLWTETHPPVTVTDGLFQVFLGAYNNLSPDLFDGSTRLLGVQLGAGPENSPRTTIVSVAYALVAAKADTAAYAYAAPGSGTNPGWVDDGATVRLTSSGDNVGIGTSTPTEKLDVNGNARVGGVLDVDGQLHISGGTPEITSELDFINFDSTRLNILGRVTMGSAFGNRRLQVSTDGTMDTIAFQAVNLTGTAGSFFSGADGLSYSSISAAVNAYADGPSYAGRFRAAGEGLGLFARTDGAGSAVHGNAAGTGYSGYFEGGLGFKVDGDFEATGSLKLPTGAGNGLVLTSDALGVASWQSAAGSPWSFNGSTVYLSDTATKGAVGITAPLTNKKFSVQTKGTNTTMALWVRNSLGTAAAFFSGDTGTTSPGVHSAVYARSGGDNNAGFFSAGGSGEGIVATSSGSGEALRTNAYGTGYSGRFSGGQGVLIDGDLKVTGPLTLPSGAAIGHVLTSDGFGNASWQPGVDASPWTQQGDFIDQVDTSAQVRIGSRLITDGPKLIVEKNGVGAATALRVRNTMGTAARFYSGTTQSSVSVWNAALHAYGHNGSHAGIFQALGDDVDCVKAVLTGTGNAIYGENTGSGYAGHFKGTSGVYVEGPIEATDDVVVQSSLTVGYSSPSSNGRLDVTDAADGIALHISNADRDIAWPTGQSLQFGDWNGSIFNPRMRITADGNVGIRTTAPAGALHVRPNADGVALHLSGASADISWPTNNTLNMGTWNGSTFDEHLRITAGGNVGIGVSSTPNILTVQQFSSTDPIADSWGTYSSRRWKENIQPLEGALDRVLQLRGVSYDWKKTGEHDIGLIAEEVGQIVPEVVHYEENGVDAQSVDYAKLTTLLIEAVKELKSDNEALKRRLEAVEKTGSGN